MNTIKFDIKKSTHSDAISLLIYRRHEESPKWGYVDSMHPMTLEEIIVLKKFLSQILSDETGIND